MDSYPFLIAEGALFLLAAVLIVECAIRRRNASRESAQNRNKNQQLASITAELKDLKKELVRKREIAETLPRITKKMTEKLPPDAYPAIAIRSIKEFSHAGKVGYFAPVEGSSDYTLEVGAGFPPDWVGNARIQPGEGILGMALKKKVVVSRTDPHSSGRRSSRGSLEDMGVTPDFVAPVFGTSGIVGALVVAECPFPLEEEKAYISMFADQMSTMIQNATLLDSTRNGTWADPLTGVANRLYFLQRFESEIRRTENYRQALALFLFDIDEFKKINDTHGHHAGDIVIRKMAEIVKKNTRGSDLVGRFGGDEFIVLITSATREQAATFAEKLRERISATEIAIPGNEVPLRITISGGIAMFPSHGQSTTELFQAADDALYVSKRQGRNRVTIAASIGLNSGISKEPEANWETPPPTEGSIDTGAEAVEFPLGEVGLDLKP